MFDPEGPVLGIDPGLSRCGYGVVARELVAERPVRAEGALRRRIDQLGTREPSIVRQGTDRIVVQAPGESDPERLKNVIAQTAKLTFQLVDETVTPDQLEDVPTAGNETIEAIAKIDDRLVILLNVAGLFAGATHADEPVTA